MQDVISHNFQMTGSFDEVVLQQWISHRALVLDVDIQFLHSEPKLIKFEAKGHPILLEALEVACSLGPSSAIVDTISLNPSLIERSRS